MTLSESKKICTKCHKEKNLDMFWNDSRASSGKRNACSECESYLRRKYYKENRTKLLKQKKIYTAKNKDKKSKYDKLYYEDNKEKIKKQKYEYKKQRLKTDINYKIAEKLRDRIRKAVKSNQKSGSAVGDLGCSIDEFKAYLEGKFYKHSSSNIEMTWSNYGYYGWHIDHIKPFII